MIDDILKNRKYVREYDTEADIPRALIDSLLEKTWKVTPSKNNFMPYKVYVLGPEHLQYKESVFCNCIGNESKTDQVADIEKILSRYGKNLPNYANIMTCSYLLIFTLRLEDQPSPFQKWLISRGHVYEAVDEGKINKLTSTASLEVGLFADTLSAICLEHGIDSSFTLCFQKDLETWKDLPFVNRRPLLLMTLGKGKIYLEDLKKKGFCPGDFKPNYDRIVEFIK